jgi:hypothetical protein
MTPEQQKRNEEIDRLTKELYDRDKTIESLRAELAALKSPKGYEEELAECEAKVAKFREEGDTHGANFYEGMWSGIVQGDIIQTNAKEALRAELAEAKADLAAEYASDPADVMLKESHERELDLLGKVLALQSHNAKLMDALEDSESDLRCYEGDPKYPAKNRTLKLVRAALASPPDNELRGRVRDYLSDVIKCEPDHYDADCQCITCGARRLLSLI